MAALSLVDTTPPRWNAAEEIDSLASELLHTYEELHLLYDLGEALTGQLPLAAASRLILERIVNTLHPAWAELHLTASETVVRVVEEGRPTDLPTRAGAAHRLRTTLRSNGETVGSIVLGQPAHEDPFSSSDSKLLDGVGTLAANALRNAQLYEELVRQSDAVREQEAHLRTVLENVADGIATVNDEGLVESLNPAAERLFGYAAAEIVGQPFANLVAEPFAVEYLGDPRRWAEYRRQRDDARRREVTGRRKDQAPCLIEMSLSETLLDGRRLYIVSMHDITERKQFETALQHRALHDLLTDLPNRVLLHDRLQQELRAAGRDRASLALLIIDLDGFKEVNDTFGHHYGDLLLQEMARRLRGALRESELVARLGGDEFAILLPGSQAETAIRISQRILRVLSRSLDLEGHTLGVGASIGIAVYPDHGTDGHDLLRRADVAMYVAKHERSGYALYNPEQDQHSSDRLAIISDLRRAIEGNELRLQYQPKVTHGGGRLECVEALVRWRHPQRGMLSPDTFVPLAERTQLIRPLGLWVLNSAIAQCRTWRDAGLNIPVAVNLSTQNLHDAQLADQLLRLLGAWGVPATQLRLEITESSLMTDPERTIDVLSRLRDCGIQTAIDDFGKGYSSLSYVTRLPVSEIKIDQSFIRRMARNDADRAIVRSTVSLGHDLGLLVTAEGVEDRTTWDLLHDLGCDIIQGYYVGRPMDAPAVTPWLERSSRSLTGTAAGGAAKRG